MTELKFVKLKEKRCKYLKFPTIKRFYYFKKCIKFVKQVNGNDEFVIYIL